jgi:hypothetical protein
VKDEALSGPLGHVIEDCLREGAVIEFDGIGTLELDASGNLTFKRNGRARVFLAYAMEDRAAVKRLYQALHAAGFEAWMDTENLLPGQNWPRAIEQAIATADYFLGCFSTRSITKRGHFQSELSYALEIASRVPVDHAFFVPVRLDDCRIPSHIAKKVHYMNLFPDWHSGIELLVWALRAHEKNKKKTDA